MKILLLGAKGMLGHRVAEQLQDLNLIATTRKEYEAFESLEPFCLTESDYVINCIGLIPQKNPSPEDSLLLNGLFPKFLSENTKAHIFNIATDCIYDGQDGYYTEKSPISAKDIYGLSKALGEIKAPNVINLRTSIIGKELGSRASLFEWVKNQPEDETIYGFANHYWNGITTDAFAKIIRGMILTDFFLAGTSHIIPRDSVSKLELINLIAKKTGRTDLTILPKIVEPVNRILATEFTRVNQLFWEVGGYKAPPSIAKLIEEMES